VNGKGGGLGNNTCKAVLYSVKAAGNGRICKFVKERITIIKTDGIEGVGKNQE